MTFSALRAASVRCAAEQLQNMASRSLSITKCRVTGAAPVICRIFGQSAD
jgi:hypothetical protein